MIRRRKVITVVVIATLFVGWVVFSIFFKMPTWALIGVSFLLGITLSRVLRG